MAVVLSRKSGSGGGAAPPDGSVTAAKINSGAEGVGDVLVSDGAGGATWQLQNGAAAWFPQALQFTAWEVNNAVSGQNAANLFVFWVHAATEFTHVAIIVNVQNGNIDVGIYDSGFDLLASSGSTACPAAGHQIVALATPVTLQPGMYYSAFASNSATMRLNYGTLLVASSTTFPQWLTKAASFPLPDPIVAPTVVANSVAYHAQAVAAP